MSNAYFVAAASLNLRAGSDNQSKILLALPHGHIVEKLSEANKEWWEVSTQVHLSKHTGYIFHKYLHPENAVPASVKQGTIKITREEILHLLPHAKASILNPILTVINDLFGSAEINANSLRVSAFFAQIATESNGLRSIVEDLYYSAGRLHAVWPREFRSVAFAEHYAGQPEKLANYIYANRLGNSDPQSGDGWRFRGRGLFQLTGRDNYHRYGKIIGMDLVSNPDQAAEPATALKIAVEYWKAEKLNALADEKNTKAITRHINGGYIGLKQREIYFERACSVFG